MTRHDMPTRLLLAGVETRRLSSDPALEVIFLKERPGLRVPFLRSVNPTRGILSYRTRIN